MFRRFTEGHAEDIKERKDLTTIFIGFHEKPTDYHHNLIRENGGFLKFSYDITNAVSARVPIDMVDTIRRLPNVKYVEKVGIMYVNNSKIPIESPIEYSLIESGLTEPYACTAWGITKIRANEAHDQGYKGTGVKIGIIDSGVDGTHPDLKDNFVEGINLIDGGVHEDSCMYGTHVAGIAANTKEDLGVAPEAKIYSAQVVKQQEDCDCCGGEDIAAAGIDWCVNKGVRIINISLGGDTDVTVLRDACNNAYNQGILIVASAGQGGGNCTSSDTVNYPARYDSCIAVSNVEDSDIIRTSSSRGPKIELAAPGTNINSTIPSNSYKCMTGTAFAAPHVTGTAALIFGAFPNLTNVDVRKALQLGAVDLTTANNSKQTTAKCCLLSNNSKQTTAKCCLLSRDNCYGYGRIDAVKSIEAAGNTKCPINIQFGLN